MNITKMTILTTIALLMSCAIFFLIQDQQTEEVLSRSRPDSPGFLSSVKDESRRFLSQKIKLAGAIEKNPENTAYYLELAEIFC